jgi:NADH:ubiquinone reductase (non-electrogenic)
LDESYDVSVVSPRNYFLFTPLLPGVTVGTNEERSIVEPIRKFCLRGGKEMFKFYEAKCTSVDVANNKIRCRDSSPVNVKDKPGGAPMEFELPYDYLIVAVGATTNTFNTPGVPENVQFLKSIEDAQALRTKIMDAIETANLPGVSDAERKRLLQFVVVGGGPTGVEFAAEVNDFFEEDLKHYFPSFVHDFSVVLVQSGDHILNTFDKRISEYTEARFKRQNIKVLTETRVKAVNPTELVVLDKKTGSLVNLPYGVCMWSTGLRQKKIVRDLVASIPEQNHKLALVTDRFLRVKGTDNIFAMGDCSEVEMPLLGVHLKELFLQADLNGDGVLTKEEFQTFLDDVVEDYPQLRVYSQKVSSLFDQFDNNHDGVLSLDEFTECLKIVDSKVKTLPATAQVASQQGKYLANAFRARASGLVASPFTYAHSGMLAKVGGTDAVADLPSLGPQSGFMTWWLWGGVYLANQYSLRNRALVALDWCKVQIFGRDVSRF